MRLLEYLLQEVELNVSFDPEKETPADVVQKAKMAQRMGSANPERAIRQRQQDIQQQKKAITADDAAEGKDPLDPLRVQIKNMEERLARMKMQLARKEQAAEQQGGQNASQ